MVSLVLLVITAHLISVSRPVGTLLLSMSVSALLVYIALLIISVDMINACHCAQARMMLIVIAKSTLIVQTDQHVTIKPARKRVLMKKMC